MKRTINILTGCIVIMSSILSVQRYAIATSYIETHTEDEPAIGCYKNVYDDRCVETTYIDCNHSLETNVVLYGSVIASMCDDMNYFKRQLERKQRINLSLRRRIENQTTAYRRVVERLTGVNGWK